MVELHFQRLFAGDVLRMHMAYDTRKVDGLASEYLRVRQKLLDLLDPTISHKDRKVLSASVKEFCCFRVLHICRLLSRGKATKKDGYSRGNPCS